ncbi:Spy/CpxP family protein refolding chaperone [Trichothermofontia sp.]
MKRFQWLLIAIAFGLGSAIVLTDGGWGTKVARGPDLGRNLAYAQASPPQMAQAQTSERLFQALDLTPAQIREIRAIQQRYAPQLTQGRQALRQAHQELSRLMATGTSNEQIRAKFRQVQQLRQQQAATHFESLLAMRSVLTPSQRRKFAELMQERQGAPRRPHGERSLLKR